MNVTEIVTRLQANFSSLKMSEFRGATRVEVAPGDLYSLLETLTREHGFDLLVDITCVDYLNYRGAQDRFGLVYLLANVEQNLRLTVRTYLNEPQLSVPSVTRLWLGADWLEREVWDMFGIHFEGHPDLRRILLPEEFAAHPLRKDYPLQGKGERHNFPVLTRNSG